MEVAISKEYLSTDAEGKTSPETEGSTNKRNIPKITNEYELSEKTYLCDRSKNDGPFWPFFRALLVWWRN